MPELCKTSAAPGSGMISNMASGRPVARIAPVML
jgi:hypothetical protein